MSDSDVTARLDDLEMRYSHQENIVEELTRTLLAQEQQLNRQQQLIERLEMALKAMESGAAHAPQDETPPHY